MFFSAVSHRASASDLTIEGNGEGAVNDVDISTNTQTSVVQSNDAIYNNDINVSAVTGDNNISDNTSDDVYVQTGDASITETIENTGNVSTSYGLCCENDLSVEVTGNGVDSANSISYASTSQTTLSSQNTLSIENSVNGAATTGSNNISGNVGNVSVETGNIRVNENIVNDTVNIVNTTGLVRSVNSVSIVVSENGAGSSSSVGITLNNADSFLVTNEADIANKSVWDLVTGENTILRDVGNIDMKTGNIIFDSFINNGPINVGGIDVPCCQDDPEDPGDPGQGGPSDVVVPQGSNPPPTILASSSTSQSQESGKSEESKPVTLLGKVLPATGGWLFLAIALNILSLIMGVFIRLRSGRSPNLMINVK